MDVQLTVDSAVLLSFCVVLQSPASSCVLGICLDVVCKIIHCSNAVPWRHVGAGRKTVTALTGSHTKAVDDHSCFACLF